MTTARTLAAVALALALTACGRSTPPPAGAATPAVTTPTGPAVTVPPVAMPPAVDLDAEIDHLVDGILSDPVTGLAFAPTPTGTASQIALRYMQALQRGDWTGAARLLALPTRNRLAFSSLEYVERVGRNVLGHAGGNQLGPCRSARWLNRDAAIVTCGRIDVVVAVHPNHLLRGVRISPDVVPYTHFAGPHTHAVTGLFQ